MAESHSYHSLEHVPSAPQDPCSSNFTVLERRHWMIRGRVQGVYYRASLQAQAQSFGLRGWCRNRANGCVEAVAEGPITALDALEAWCWQGPPMAQVEEVLCLERITLDSVAVPTPQGVMMDSSEEGRDEATQSSFAVRATV